MTAPGRAPRGAVCRRRARVGRWWRCWSSMAPYVRLLPRRYEPPGRHRTGRIARFSVRGRGRRSAELEHGELGTGAEGELAEHGAQGEVDRARAEEQLGGGVPGGQALPNERGDLPFLGGELGR